MATKRTMTLNLSEAEMNVVEALCKKKGLSKTALLRQALRLYQSIDERLERGEKLYLEEPSKKEKSELLVL
ncbi:MAG TPA: ribbon-helix-helix protein, CopG family [Gammaproteobacteria bacterium]|nr:ribbon-helix-helix protein, CopG family [Gammaproteobacteria bacterium]